MLALLPVVTNIGSAHQLISLFRKNLDICLQLLIGTHALLIEREVGARRLDLARLELAVKLI